MKQKLNFRTENIDVTPPFSSLFKFYPLVQQTREKTRGKAKATETY